MAEIFWQRRAVQWGTVVLAVIGFVSGVAGLTVDLPEAGPKWVRWLTAIPEPIFNIVLFVAFLLAVFLLFREQREHRRLENELELERRQRLRLEEEAEQVASIDADAIAAEMAPPAPREGIAQLLMVYPYLKNDARQACGFLEWACNESYSVGGEKGIIGRLVEGYVVERCLHAQRTLDQTMYGLATSGITAPEFGELLKRFEGVLVGGYLEMATWVREAGSRILPEEIFLQRYGDLLREHEKTVEELRRVSGHPDIGTIAHRIDLFARCLPPLRPSAGPPPTTAS